MPLGQSLARKPRVRFDHLAIANRCFQENDIPEAWEKAHQGLELAQGLGAVSERNQLEDLILALAALSLSVPGTA